MKKRLYFFDGDGTLWYPKETKRTIKPHWVYQDPTTKDSYLEQLTLTPGVAELLPQLYEQEIFIVVISAHPGPQDQAMTEMQTKLTHFGIADYIYSYHITPGDNPHGKTAVIKQVLAELGLKPSQAVMIGDSYSYDYLGGKDAGIDALWIQNPSCKVPDTFPEDLTTITEISDLLT
jgi:FMN phosphatase YigB (HAD superfamily)